MASKKSRYTNEGASARPPIVGIGASAGGLAAIQGLFDNLSNDTGAAFIVVQHLSPDFKSLMDEILARHTKMRIVRVEQECKIEPNSIYLLQPRDELHVEGNLLKTKPRPDTARAIPYPVDTLFESMARSGGDPGIAIVLSGTGSDGSRGVRRIKEEGGIVLVQDPETAEFDGMPNAAIATGCVDRSIDPAGMAEVVARLVNRTINESDATTATLTDNQPYERILELLRAGAGYDLTSYKPGTISRRIERRMALHHLTDAETYIALLQSDEAEIQQLAQDCLIHVTYFFRDPEAFRELETHVREVIEASPKRRDTFRVWVAGCSTGEEVYSVAAMLDRVIRELSVPLDFKIFATDLDDNALNTASAARYPITALVDIPLVDQDVMIRQNDEVLAVAPALRNRVVFARHDVLKDPPFPRADLICCRNLLIYLDTKAQAAVFDRFLFSLRRSGLLFLGNSETVEPAGDGFSTIHAKHRVFRKVAEPKRLVLNQGAAAVAPARTRHAVQPSEVMIKAACERLVEMFADAGMVISNAGEVLHSFGDVSRWLRLPKGKITTRIDELLPQEARSPVSLALRQARSSAEAVRVGAVSSYDGAATAVLDIAHITPDAEADAIDVLLFRLPSSGPSSHEPGARPIDNEFEASLDAITRDQIETLERELAATRENLQASIEELETTNEELQSVNEELLASNEELQSTNEELHSVNEELYTVNSEHQQKIGELVDVTEDLEHLLQATKVGTLFLDRTLTIRRFTSSVTMALPLRNQDVGRSLNDLHTHLLEADLPRLVRTVMDSGEAEERRYLTESGVPVLVGVQPYRRGSAGGAVLTFVDVRRLEESVRHDGEKSGLLNAIDQISGEVIRITDAESLQVVWVSKAYERIWGPGAGNCLENNLAWAERIHPDDRDRVEKEFFEKVRSGSFDCEYRIQRPDGSIRWIRDRCYAQGDTGSGTAGTRASDRPTIISISEDVTKRVEAERARRRDTDTYRAACTQTRVPMAFVDKDGELQWHNDAFASLCGKSPVKSIAHLIKDDDVRTTWRRQAAAICSGTERDALLEADLLVAPTSAEDAGAPQADPAAAAGTQASGRTNTVRFQISLASIQANEQQPLMVCQLTDLSDHVERHQALAQQAQELASEALTDALTGLSNRRGADRRLERMLTRDRRRSETTMAILIDCDNFKSINDHDGYDSGDAVLREIAVRMTGSLRPDDLSARVGGDEFLAVLSATRLAEAAHVGDKLRRAICDVPVEFEAADGTLKSIKVTVSVGVLPIPEGVATCEQILANAGQVLHRSKLLGRNRVSFADEEGDLPSITQALDDLLKGDRLRIVRQTLNDTETGEVVGHELLARGPEPWVAPAALFDLFQRHDRMEDLDLRCLNACIASINAETDAHDVARPKKGRKAGAPVPQLQRCHVNLLPSSLLKTRWPEVRAMLQGVRDPARVTIELSEQQFIGPSAELRKRLAEVRGFGFKIALDDVGFGRSALETLLAVEPEVVKIDRSIVAGVERNPGNRRVLERLVQLLAGMPCELIAEGVESDAQRKVLCEVGVGLGQGFLWSHPDRTNERRN